MKAVAAAPPIVDTRTVASCSFRGLARSIWQYSPVHSDVQLHIPGAMHSPPFSQSG